MSHAPLGRALQHAAARPAGGSRQAAASSAVCGPPHLVAAHQQRLQAVDAAAVPQAQVLLWWPLLCMHARPDHTHAHALIPIMWPAQVHISSLVRVVPVLQVANDLLSRAAAASSSTRASAGGPRASAAARPASEQQQQQPAQLPARGSQENVGPSHDALACR